MIHSFKLRFECVEHWGSGEITTTFWTHHQQNVIFYLLASKQIIFCCARCHQNMTKKTLQNMYLSLNILVNLLWMKFNFFFQKWYFHNYTLVEINKKSFRVWRLEIITDMGFVHVIARDINIGTLPGVALLHRISLSVLTNENTQKINIIHAPNATKENTKSVDF